MSAHSVKPTGPFAPQYIHGVYIPAGLIIVGTFIVRREWLPYAVVLAAVLGAWKIYNNRNSLVKTRRAAHADVTVYSSSESAEAERIPAIRIEREDDYKPQYCYVGCAIHACELNC